VPRAPRLIAIGGLSGSGKSRLARHLAPLVGPPPGARVVRTDSTRKRLAGVPLGSRLGASFYSETAGQRTYEAVTTEAADALAGGRAVIADAVFARPEERAAIARVAAELGVPFHAIWLEASPHTLQERVARRRHNVSDATPAVVRMQLDYDLGPLDWPRLDSSADGDATVAAALRLLGLPAPGLAA
jgi:predicted kinase